MGSTVTDVGLSKNKKHELKKHAATIHCSNTLSLLQRKVSNALLYHAYKELLKKEEHEISIKQLCHLIEYNGNNHSVIKDALKGLLSTVIEWNLVSDTTASEDWTASSILASVSLQGPICYYAYSPRMKQLLYSPSMFGKVNLYIQSRFKSSYGLALYENCIRYRGLSFTKWFDMDTFRKLMGVPSGNYTIFRDFKRRVLDKSVEEVNTYSDLLVEPELIRERRRVMRVRFLLKERTKKVRLGTVSTEEEGCQLLQVNPLRSKMITQFSLSPTQAEKVLHDYEHAYITEKISIIEASHNYQSGKVKNIAGYLLSALKNDYHAAQKGTDVYEQQKREQELAASNLRKLENMHDEVEKSYFSYREKMIDNIIEQLDTNKKEKFMKAFYQYADKTIQMILKVQRNKYKRSTVLQSPQVKSLLREFALRVMPDLQTQVVSIEQFLDNFGQEHRTAWYQFKLLTH